MPVEWCVLTLMNWQKRRTGGNSWVVANPEASRRERPVGKTRTRHETHLLPRSSPCSYINFAGCRSSRGGSPKPLTGDNRQPSNECPSTDSLATTPFPRKDRRLLLLMRGRLPQSLHSFGLRA